MKHHKPVVSKYLFNVTLEDIDDYDFHRMWKFNRLIRTQSGQKPIREHLFSDCRGRGDDRETTLYRCRSCGSVCCECFGGADDPRCDDCVAGEKNGRHLSP